MPIFYAQNGQPSTNPVTIQEVKDHLRIDGSDFDPQLNSLAAAVTRVARRAFGRQFITGTLIFTMPGFLDQIEIPRPPLQEVTSVEYQDTDGNWQTIDAGNYEVSTQGDHPGILRFHDDYEFPELYEHAIYPVKITFKAGYGDTETDVPADMKLWMKQIIGSYWMHPQATIVGTEVNEIESIMNRLVGGKVMRFG